MPGGEPAQKGTSAETDGRRPPTHPGAILREGVMPHLSITAEELAARLSVPPDQLAPILAERAAISPEIAWRISEFCGNGPLLWLGMQEARDLWDAGH